MADLYAKGSNGVITIDGDSLTIDRKGFGRAGHLTGDRRIPLASITAVQLQYARVFKDGFIRFTVAGSTEFRGGLHSAMRDENAVTYRRRHARGSTLFARPSSSTSTRITPVPGAGRANPTSPSRSRSSANYAIRS